MRGPSADRAAVEARRVERVYSVLSRVYDDAFDWALGPGRRRAIERLEARPGERVLEVGVGTGLSLPFYPEGVRVTGIDISEPMLEQARRRAEEHGRPDVDLRRMDAHALEYGDATFDRVVAPYVISVVPDPERVMREVHRVCKPGGRVVVVNHFRSRNPVLGSAERLLTPASQWIGFRLDLPIERVSRTAGLRIVDVEGVNLLRMWRLIVFERAAAASAALSDPLPGPVASPPPSRVRPSRATPPRRRPASRAEPAP